MVGDSRPNEIFYCGYYIQFVQYIMHGNFFYSYKSGIASVNAQAYELLQNTITSRYKLSLGHKTRCYWESLNCTSNFVNIWVIYFLLDKFSWPWKAVSFLNAFVVEFFSWVSLVAWLLFSIMLSKSQYWTNVIYKRLRTVQPSIDIKRAVFIGVSWRYEKQGKPDTRFRHMLYSHPLYG